jgi:hypothetical protein
MVLREELLEGLLKVLEHRFDRNPEGYRFLIRSGYDRAEGYSYLDRFLKDENVPFEAMGVNLISGSLFPARGYAETEKNRMPTGLYPIYPQTGREIVLYLYQDVNKVCRDVPRCIAGYRSEKAFEEFFDRYRRFCAAKERERNTIGVFRGEDIAMPDLSWDDLILNPVLKTDIKWHVESFMALEHLYRHLASLTGEVSSLPALPATERPCCSR